MSILFETSTFYSIDISCMSTMCAFIGGNSVVCIDLKSSSLSMLSLIARQHLSMSLMTGNLFTFTAFYHICERRFILICAFMGDSVKNGAKTLTALISVYDDCHS